MILVNYSTKLFLITILLVLLGCDGNNPYPNESSKLKTLYTSFSEQPKHLDPATSYSSNEWVIINQIYEPPLQYHYLKRPYVLEPLVAQEMPEISYVSENGKIAYTIYDIKIKPGIYYQPHPAFKTKRELIAQDFVYQIKRLGDPTLSSPIFGLMQNYIVGLDEFEQNLRKQPKNFDLKQYDLAGAKVISKYHYQIKIIGDYPQFIYWLAMPFFAPMPWEVAKQGNLELFPVGTGPFLLSENNPNQRMVLLKNPNYHGERYPNQGEAGDEAKGLLTLKNKRLPFLDRIVFSLETESVPYWNKFLQGYYDQSGISSDTFDQVFEQSISSIKNNSGLGLTQDLKDKKIQIETAILPSLFYWGFNMLDETVGGYTDSKRQLRQALSLTMDIEEYIEIFLNGRGVVAQSPIPQGIFGFVEAKAKAKSKSIVQAKQLLAQAGYPNGIDPKTKAPLILYLDATMGGGPDSNAIYAWTRKQFKKLNIDLVVRATQYNRFQEKMRTGNAQIFSWGWNADYPDPENFLFLLYGPNGKVKEGGENAGNYFNLAYDRLFDEMKVLPNGPKRQEIINRMIGLLENDRPWMAAYNPLFYTLSHQWFGPEKVNALSRNTFKYINIDVPLREKQRKLWNKPIFWPLVLFGFGFLALCFPAVLKYHQKMYQKFKFTPRGDG